MRSLEDHLSPHELASLPGSPAALASGGSGRHPEWQLISGHLQLCEECASVADAHWGLRDLGEPIGAAIAVGECPKDDIWLELAAGLKPDKAATILAHAASCDACAAELKEAMDLMRPEPSVATDEELSALRSSTLEWQEDLAARLASSTPAVAVVEIVQKPKVLPWRAGWWGSIAAVLLLAATVFGVRQYQAGTDSALLAKAFDQRRLTDLRLTEGSPVERSSTFRGGSPTEVPIDLLKLKLRAEEHLVTDPRNAYWHQELGRVALVDGDGEAAQKQFAIAAVLDPKLSGLTLDQGSATFEIADALEGKDKDPIKFAAAAQLFGQALAGQLTAEQRSIAYYNRALCWERMSMPTLAIQDYKSALASERNGVWRAAIQGRLNKLQPKPLNSELNRVPRRDLSATAFLREVQQNSRQGAEDYETFLVAVPDWLVQRGNSPVAAKALQQLAAIGRQHKDAWLEDLLMAPDTDSSRAANVALRDGLKANERGEADVAYADLTQAAKIYRSSQNSAGELRAQVELAYTLQRLGRSDQCVDFAGPLEQNRRLPRYSWLYGYFLLELATCRGIHGNLVTYTDGARRALEVSQAGGFRLQTLRDRGFLVEGLEKLGQTRAAWTLARQGLQDADALPGTSMSKYQFLYEIYKAMQEMDLNVAAQSVAEAAAQTSIELNNLQVKAYAQEVLGTAETATGEIDKAKVAFRAASDVLRSMPEGPATRLYRADWEADRSVLLVREGQMDKAVERMRNIQADIASTDSDYVRQRYYTEFAHIYLAAHQPGEALQQVLFAIRDAERGLGAASTELQRLTWERSNGRGYRLLVECLVDMNQPEEALRAWEWYRSAAYREAVDDSQFELAGGRLTLLPASQWKRRPALTLVFAKLEDYDVAWSIAASPAIPARMVKLAASHEKIAGLAKILAELCADRTSSNQDIQLVGATLYRQLLSPFDDQIRQAALMLLDVDSSLEHVPFTALVDSENHYLNDAHSLAFLPAWWTLHEAQSGSITRNENVLLVEGAANLPRGIRRGGASLLPPEYLESRELRELFTHATLLDQNQVSLDLLRTELPKVDVFHFSGHTFTVNNQMGLLISAPDVLFTAASLHGMSMRRCRLAVLATCSSAGQAAEELDETSRLPHALLTVGVANVVAELWDVDSRASRILMLQFYDSLFRGVSIPDAVRDGQQKLRHDPITNHPFFWSSTKVFSQ